MEKRNVLWKNVHQDVAVAGPAGENGLLVMLRAARVEEKREQEYVKSLHQARYANLSSVLVKKMISNLVIWQNVLNVTVAGHAGNNGRFVVLHVPWVEEEREQENVKSNQIINSAAGAVLGRRRKGKVMDNK